MSPFDHSTHLQGLLDRLRAGDDPARDALVGRAFDRLHAMARRMFRGYPSLRAAVETDDVLQGAAVRFHRALDHVRPPTVRQFFALAGSQIRRELIDLARRHLGHGGVKAARVVYVGGPASRGRPGLLEAQPDAGGEPAGLGEWTEFHEHAASLPPEEREVFDLLWYQGLGQEEAAALLGVSGRTVKRRWRSARVLLYDALHGDMPSE
jgi:DNA-directed RNA polymerase specialized sigma24 family protein